MTTLFALNNHPRSRAREIRLPNAVLDTFVDPRTERRDNAIPPRPRPLIEVLARVDALHAHCTPGARHLCGVPVLDLYTYVKAQRAYRAAVALEAI